MKNEPDLNPKHPILIVDDDEAILLSIDTTLQMAGWDNIITCSDSRQVMNILSSRQVEIVLLDLNMPHISGEDLLPNIKETVDIPVIIVTGSDKILEDDCHTYFGSHHGIRGPDGVLGKPVDRSTLLAVLNKVIDSAR